MKGSPAAEPTTKKGYLDILDEIYTECSIMDIIQFLVLSHVLYIPPFVRLFDRFVFGRAS